MVQSLQPKGHEFESTHVLVLFFVLYFYLYSIRLASFIIDVPRPLSNFLWIIIFKRLMRISYTETVCLEHLHASKYNNIRNITPENPIFRSVISIL